MASKAVVDAVKAILTAQWSATPVQYSNTEGETPLDGSAFLVVQFPVANEEQISIGSPGAQLWRESGGIRFVLAVPRKTDLAQGLTWADSLRALFRGRKIATGVQCFGASPAVETDSNEAGKYFRLALVVTYTADIFG